jgi:hypothetical protein
MRYLIGIALTLTCLIGQVHAQSYNGFQTNGVHSCFFSLSWNGKAHIGFGYNFRNFESSFSDYQLEARIPLDNIENLENYSIIGGIYRPSRLQRTFVGGGAHLILIKSEEGMQLDHQLSGNSILRFCRTSGQKTIFYSRGFVDLPNKPPG